MRAWRYIGFSTVLRVVYFYTVTDRILGEEPFALEIRRGFRMKYCRSYVSLMRRNIGVTGRTSGLWARL
jgi:hypothetical protein